MPPETLLNRYCPAAIHGKDHPIPECPLEIAVAKNGMAETEFHEPNKDRWVKSIAYPTGLVTPEGRKVFFHMLQDVTDIKVAEENLQKSVERLKSVLSGIVSALTKTIERRDPYTAGHQQRVSALAKALAQKLGLSQDRCQGLEVAGILHDVGKIAVPAEILCKPGKLTDQEYQIIKGHAEVGHDILSGIDFPWPIAEIVYQHHERIDGSGYPQGLKGNEILLEAKILAVADVVEAMSSHRPYRQALGIEKSLAEISAYRDILYDAEVVDACLNLLSNKSIEELGAKE